jgi:glycosyltransferase involved in cell wall biosynthesis
MQLDNTSAINNARHPKVSVLMITYNHAKYIGQAIESVLMQKTTFPMEVVIGEDCSTDGTRAIVQTYSQRYPELIRAILPETNQGPFHNLRRTLNACRGEYVAGLEGDDYWTDPNKLQIQADFLDSHPECASSFHKVMQVFDDGSRPSVEAPNFQKHAATIEDLLAGEFGNLIPSCSAMWRRGLFDSLPHWVEEIGFSDWVIHVLNAAKGRAGFINRCMGVYRIHAGGIWSTQSWRSVMERWVKAYDYIDRELGGRYHSICIDAKFRRLAGYAVGALERGDPDARSSVWRALRTGPPYRRAREKASLLLRLYAPALLRGAARIKRGIRLCAPAPRP